MKYKRNYDYLLIVYAIMLLFTSFMISCTYPVVEMVVKTTETVKEPEIPEEEIIEMELKTIIEYEKYVFTDSKKLFGLVGAKKELIVLENVDGVIHPVNDFFVKTGKVYFNIKYMIQGDPIPDTDPVQYEAVEQIDCYSQSNSTLEKITSLPAKPLSKFVEMGIAPYSIVSGDYNGTPISTIKQVISETKKPVKNFLKIDSYFYNQAGLWFTVCDGIPGAKKGLYFWPVKDGKVGKPKELSGMIW